MTTFQFLKKHLRKTKQYLGNLVYFYLTIMIKPIVPFNDDCSFF